MKVIISGGGTGGHIYPALSILEGLENTSEKLDVLYIGTTNRMESKIIPELGINYLGLEMQGINRKNLIKNFKTIYQLLKNNRKLKKVIKEFNPDIVIGTGGYITVPALYTASKLNIPTLIFDADANFGMATNFLAKHVDIICSGYEQKQSKYDNIKYTGNPRGQDVYHNVAIKSNSKVMYIFGSLGSTRLNDFFSSYFNNNVLEDEVLYVTGKGLYEKFASQNTNSKVTVVEYVDNIAETIGETKYVVSRSGATFVSEMHALAMPAIYIPSPNVANNEQYFNAKKLVDINGSLLIEDNDLTEDVFNEYIKKMNDNYAEYKKNLELTRVLNSRDLIVNEIISLVGGKNG